MSEANGIRATRVRKGISMDQLARSAHISKAYISAMETSRSARVSLSVARRISAALDAPMSELWPHDGEYDAMNHQEIGVLSMLSEHQRLMLTRVLVMGTGFEVVAQHPQPPADDAGEEMSHE